MGFAKRATVWGLAMVVFAHCAGARAEPGDADRLAALKAAWVDAGKAATMGPAKLPMAGEATLQLPADEAFVPAAAANRVMKAMGNAESPSRFGLIVSKDPKVDWLIDVAWTKDGYVRDGEAKAWKADALLKTLRDGTEAANIERAARGFPQLDVVGWAEPPAYDAAAHRLVWSLLLRDRKAPPNEPQTVNYNTYALGREGYFELDLITSSQSIAAEKGVVRALLGQLAYLPGKRYDEFNPSTDKVAAYGIAALIGVVAAKKIGLLAMFGLFLVKIWKVALIAVAGIVPAIRRFFRRDVPPAQD